MMTINGVFGWFMVCVFLFGITMILFPNFFRDLKKNEKISFQTKTGIAFICLAFIPFAAESFVTTNELDALREQLVNAGIGRWEEQTVKVETRKKFILIPKPSAEKLELTPAAPTSEKVASEAMLLNDRQKLRLMFAGLAAKEKRKVASLMLLALRLKTVLRCY